MAREPLQRRRPASSRNGESEGKCLGKGEGKYNGVFGEPLQRRWPISSRNGESEGTCLGKREGKHNGEGAVAEEAAHIIKEQKIRRY
jgi:hypothetical protein